MKLETHMIFSVGLSSIILIMSTCKGICLFGALGVVIVEQYLIDLLSHESKGGYIRRTKLFHSLTGIFFLSLILSLTYSLLIFKNNLLYSITIVFPGIFIGGLSHLFLDMLNPGGIYVRGRRVRILNVEYDDFIWNVFFQIIGLILLLLSIRLYII